MKFFKLMMAIAIVAGITYSCATDDDFPTGTTAESDRIELYVTSNTTGNITMYDVKDLDNVTFNSHQTGAADTEGLSYNIATDELSFASRSDGTLNTVASISMIEPGAAYTTGFVSSADMVSPRDITVRSGFYVVSDNDDVDGDPLTDDGRFFIYQRDNENYVLRNTVTLDFAVAGIQFIGSSLLAVVDKTGEIAVFNSFTATNQTDDVAVPTRRITIAGITRTQGFAYNGSTAVFTDIGDIAVDNDGAFHIINNFEAALESVVDGGTIGLESQIRVSGAATELGNPVAAAYDGATNTVYIAERANSSGRILAFRDVSDEGGNIAPTYNSQLAGASSVLLYRGN
jgi:hypothetical protein